MPYLLKPWMSWSIYWHRDGIHVLPYLDIFFVAILTVDDLSALGKRVVSDLGSRLIHV